MVPVSMESNMVSMTATSAPPEKVQEYKKVSALLETLRKVEKDRLLQYLPDSPRVLDIQKQIAEKETAMTALEAEFPQLLGTPTAAATQMTADGPVVTQRDVWIQLAQIRQIQSKIGVLNEQMQKIRLEAAQIAEIESDINELRRKRDLLERNYKDFSSRLSSARFDDALSSGRISNISTVESPTPPSRTITKTAQIAIGVAIGSLLLGIAVAFGIEMYLDRSIKRPIEIEQKLKVPLFLSIPYSRNSRRKLLGAPATNGNGHATNGNTPPAFPWNEDSEMRTYYETLRDRLLLFFEAQNLTHKPKLVAVTGCAPSSGVSTIASGLAATLSETGDGNVLLVDMNELERGAAAHFHHGKLACGLDELLEGNGTKREDAMVTDNLFVVADSPGDRNLPRILHKRFQSLIPKLRASDYDYIIFDMPAVSQISPTSRLARFMDMVFLVVESEKTDRDIVKRAVDMLTQTKANVGVVLNKTRTYVPKALQQEL
ncbi:MAG TPA: hypothetical protein VEH04_05205 [Verrucomicrobiae bacterium]|nr:hypothetical protein [Verrucomicrobiae bacterium]